MLKKIGQGCYLYRGQFLVHKLNGGDKLRWALWVFAYIGPSGLPVYRHLSNHRLRRQALAHANEILGSEED